MWLSAGLIGEYLWRAFHRYEMKRKRFLLSGRTSKDPLDLTLWDLIIVLVRSALGCFWLLCGIAIFFVAYPWPEAIFNVLKIEKLKNIAKEIKIIKL